MAPQDSDIFGVRPRESSNAFACGAHQNVGNQITDTPTTRVLKPPGGGSSICLSGGSNEPQGRLTTGGKARVPPPQSYISDSRVSLGQDNASAASAQHSRGNQATKNKVSADDMPFAGVRTNRLHEMRVETADRLGKIKQKTDPDTCSSSGTDCRSKEDVRFYRDTNDQKLGRQQKPAVFRPEATKSVCESHRYYLAADGQADRLTGKAAPQRCSSEASLTGGYPFRAAGKPRSQTSAADPPPKPSRSSYGISRRNDDGYSQSNCSRSEKSQARKAYGSSSSQTTSAAQSRCSQTCYSASQADSIPFGADWSTFYD